MALRIHLLGQVSLESESTIVPASALPGRQGRLAFAYLTLAKHPVPRDQLAEIVWPDELARSWERDLSAVVSKLKGPLAKVGAPDAIKSALGCYELALPDGAIVDVDTVRKHVEDAEAALRRDSPDEAWGAASTAVHLARRPFLPGEQGDWVESVRRDVNALFVRAADALVAVELGRSRWADAERYAEESIAREPFRESGYVALVDLHIASGNRAQALRSYERARTLLAEELGVPPSAPLEEAYRRALDADATPLAPATPAAAAITGTVTLLFTDLVGSTAIADRLSTEESEQLRRSHFRLLRDAVATTGGQEIKNLGDGLMIAFGRARDALSCAVAIQEAIQHRNRDTESVDIAVRIGVHVGEPTVEDGDYFGMPVVIAKRLCDLAGGGEIIASDLACTLASATEGFDLGPVEPMALKGIEQPLPARKIGWRPVSESPLPLPPVVRVVDDQFAFVGRGVELASLVDRVQHTQSPELVVVEGEPGVGKTRLLVEAVTDAQQRGATVLWGRCAEEPLGAFQPWVEALDYVVTALPVHELRVVVGQGASDLARIVPKLAERLPSVRPADSSEGDRHALFDSVSRCLATLASSRPVVMVIDDLHWADGPTMQLLGHVLRSPEGGSLLVLASARAGRADWSSEATAGFADIVRTERRTTVALGGLDEAAVTALLELDDQRMHPEGFALARSLQATTGGNPFFIREVVRSLVEAGRLEHRDGRWIVADPHQQLDVPAGVASVVGRRLARLSEAARDLLSLASVVGNDFDVPLLVELTGRNDDEVLDLLDEAVDAMLVVEPQGGIDRFTFTHAIVRDALHTEIGPSRRSRHHRRVAEALERLGAEETRIAELAHHWCAAGAAGDLHRGAECASLAGDAALGQLAYEEAANHFDAALAATRSQPVMAPAIELDLLLAVVDAYAKGSDPRAVATYREAIDRGRSASDSLRFSRAVLGLTGKWQRTGLIDDERERLIDQALDGLPDDSSERATLLGRRASDLWLTPGMETLRDEWSAEALAIA